MNATGDVALVTGAGGTLGRAVVAALAARGDRVVAVTREGEVPGLPGELAAAVRVETADLTVPSQVEALWDRAEARGDHLRWVVNTVGGYRPGAVADTAPEDYAGMLGLNLATAWASCRAAASHLAPGGAVVNVASRAALTGSAGAAAYAVSKAGVVRLTQVLADELAGRGVRVNVVLPALIAAPGDESAPLRAVSAGDIAAVVAFLCSDAARAVTGAAVPVYGVGPR